MTQLRDARPDELADLGALVASAYAALPGMPGPDQQPDYYRMLRDAAGRARDPAITVVAAVADDGALLGAVDFIADAASYGAGGVAAGLTGTAGIRLLAVAPGARGRGIGRALTRACIDRARALGRSQVILHTTRAMTTAWALYRDMGFERVPALDFRQGELEVFGFQLALDPA